MRIFTKLSDGIATLFRQHQWYNKTYTILDYEMDDTVCRRCGDSMPIPMKHINLGWWQGGCPGEKQLLKQAMEKE